MSIFINFFKIGLLFLLLFPFNLFSGTLNFYLENDFIFDDDSDYSNGVRIEYKFSDYSIFLEQSIYTPDNIKNPEYIAGTHPYAGFLGVGGSLTKRTPLNNKNKFWTNYLELMVGIVGPSSQAEEIQRGIHKMIGANAPKGWDKQLHDEFEIQLAYWTGSDKIILSKCNNKFNISLIDEIGGMVGTMYDCLGINSGIKIAYGDSGDNCRIGQLEIRGQETFDLDRKYSSSNNSERGFYTHLFLGNETRWWMWNVFLDGNRDGDSYSVDKEKFTTALKIGAGVGYKKIFFSTIVLFCTKEYSTQTETPNYINFQLSVRF